MLFRSVHSAEEYEAAVEASQILFSNKASETLHKIDEDTLLAVFEGVPQFEVPASVIEAGIPVVDLLAEQTKVFASKGEMKKLTQGGGVSVNKDKITDTAMIIDNSFLLNGKYILAQRGKKNYYLIIAK